MNNPQAELDNYLSALTDTDLDNAFWHFSLKFYRIQGVSSRLLILQDTCQLNINSLLFIFWLKQQGLIVDNTFLQPLLRLLSTMDEQYLQPLRHLRRQLQTWTASPKPYQHSKVLELHLEQHQIALIYTYYQQQRPDLEHRAIITNNDAFIFWQNVDNAKNIFSILDEITDLSGMFHGQE